jgi:hypothetical protein
LIVRSQASTLLIAAGEIARQIDACIESGSAAGPFAESAGRLGTSPRHVARQKEARLKSKLMLCCLRLTRFSTRPVKDSLRRSYSKLQEQDSRNLRIRWKEDMLGMILIVVLILMLIGALPTWPHSRNWGYYPSGGIGTIAVILVILLLLGRI